MQFDFDTFAKITARVFPSNSSYSLNEALEVFRYYFQAFEDYTGHPHPHIRVSQIQHICEVMPDVYLENRGGWTYVAPEQYEAMIDQHFQTEYRRCDYNINHFFSGDIRAYRFFETCF